MCASAEEQNRTNWATSVNVGIAEMNKSDLNDKNLVDILNGISKLSESQYKINQEKNKQLLIAQEETDKNLQSLSADMQTQQVAINNFGKRISEITQNSDTNYQQDQRIKALENQATQYAKTTDINKKIHILSLEVQNNSSQMQKTTLTTNKKFLELDKTNDHQSRRIDALETNKQKNKDSIEKLEEEMRKNRQKAQDENRDLQQQIHKSILEGLERENSRDNRLEDMITNARNENQRQYEKRITDIDRKISDGQSYINDMMHRLSAQESTIAGSLQDIKGLRDATNSLRKDIQTNSIATTNNNREIQGNQKELTSIKERVNRLEQNTNVQPSNFAPALSPQQITDLKDTIKTLEAELANLRQNMNDLERRTNTQMNDLERRTNERMNDLEIKTNERMNDLEIKTNAQMNDLEKQQIKDASMDKAQDEKIKQNRQAIEGQQDKTSSSSSCTTHILDRVAAN
jgi:DNA repair exonuclease SbcCD ATPase subunit